MILGGAPLAGICLGTASFARDLSQFTAIAYDISGYDHDGTYSGTPTLQVPGALTVDPNLAVTFDADDSADMGDADVLSFPTNIFTLEFYYKTTSTTDSHEGLLGKATDPFEYGVYRVGTTLNFKAWTSAGVAAYSTSYTIPDTNFHHYVWAADGTNARLYVDAVLQTTVAKSGSSMVNTTAAFKLGDVITP